MRRTTLELPHSASVLLPTFQAERYLERVLDALARQETDFPWDLHVLDCGSTDRTLELLALRATRFPVRLTVHHLRDCGFDHGDARNRLAALSDGALLVYLTDDAIPAAPEWLSNLRAYFADARVGAAYCRNTPRPDARPFARIATNGDPTYAHGSRRSERPPRAQLAALGPEELRSLYAFCDTASATRRSLWERHPYPITSAGEDVLLARGLIDAGYVVQFASDAAVLHSHEWDEERLRRRAQVDGRFNSETFGRWALGGPDDVERQLAESLARDAAALEAEGLRGETLRSELEHAARQRRAYFGGLFEGQRTNCRRLSSAMLPTARLSIALVAAPDNVEVARAAAQALRERGHNCVPLAQDSTDTDWRGIELVHFLDPTDLARWSRCNPAAEFLPAVVTEPNAWRLLAFGTGSCGWSEAATLSQARIEAPRGTRGALHAHVWESRYRALACSAATPIVYERWARECELREGAVRAQGGETLLLGPQPAALHFELGPLPPGDWALELQLELLAEEPTLALRGRVLVDDAQVGEFGPLVSAGTSRIETLEFALPGASRPRRVSVLNGMGGEPLGFVRLRRLAVRRSEARRSAPSIAERLERLRVTHGARLADEQLPRVSVVIPTVDGRLLLERCLPALAACDYPSALVETIVVDNGSRDGTARFLAREHPRVRRLDLGSNQGFTRAVTAGVDAATRPDVLVLLNNDVVVEREWLRELVSPIARGECAASGARMEFPDGRPEFLGGGASFQGFAIGFAPGEDQPGAEDARPRKALFACGGAMAISAQAWRDVGGLDTEFFAYYDDLDLGWRLWLHGHEVHYAPAARCRHARSSTSRRFPREAVRKLQVRNALLCCIKNYDDEHLDRLLPVLLALAARRTWVMARRTGAPELELEGRRPLPTWLRRLTARDTFELDALAFADLTAVNEVLGAWEHWMRRRAAVQARRRASDAQLFELFLDPLWCVEGEHEYVQLQNALQKRMGLESLFDAAPPAPPAQRAPREARLAPARGCFESIDVDATGLRCAGWLLALDGEVEEVELLVDNRRVACVTVSERPDVGAAFPGAAWAAKTGFEMRAASPANSGDAWRRVEARGLRAGRAVASMACLWRADYRELFADPPAERMLRVVGAAAPVAFRLDGLRTLAEFLDALTPHRAPQSIAKVLDWGAGCGRVSGFLRSVTPTWHVRCCDVDHEAVAWSREHHRGCEFAASPFDPPLSYASGSFDLVLAYSVFTHLDRARQLAWLAELHRVLDERGILLATVQGPEAARLLGLADVAAALRERGISDEIVDHALDGVAPDGLYRSTFQSEAWTRRAWGRDFEILDYLPRAAVGLQDIVVLRKRSRGSG